jgi:alcohol oxidase
MEISGLEIGIKWRPEPSELPAFGPEFKEVWDSHYANAPDKPVLWMGIISACSDPFLVPPRNYFAMVIMSVSTLTSTKPPLRMLTTPDVLHAHRRIQEYPVARGHAHITHAEDVSAPLDFVPGYLESSVPPVPSCSLYSLLFACAGWQT